LPYPCWRKNGSFDKGGPINGNTALTKGFSLLAPADLSSRVQPSRHTPEACQCGLQAFHGLFSDDVGIGNIVQIGKGLVLEPGDVERGLVAGEDILVGELVPAAFGIASGFERLCALMAVRWVVTRNEVRQVIGFQQILLESGANVRAVIIGQTFSV
jgi:hypothetical protein